MRGLFRLILFWITISNKYDRLKRSPYRDNSISLGVTSLALSIIGILSAVGFVWLAFLCFSTEGLISILAVIFGVICVLAAFLCFIEMVLASIVYAVYQMKLNRKAVGKVALAVSLLLSVGTVVAIVIVLGLFL